MSGVHGARPHFACVCGGGGQGCMERSRACMQKGARGAGERKGRGRREPLGRGRREEGERYRGRGRTFTRYE
eukprot:355241-Chlamydomonas_euryale.AAC.2